MAGPSHKLRALAVSALLPMLLAAGEGPCLLCKVNDVSAEPFTAHDIPLSIEITTKLDFSRTALTQSGGGQIEVDPVNGRRQMNGGIVDLGGTAIAGTAVVRGTPGRMVRIDMPRFAHMTSSTGGMVEIADLRTSLIGTTRLNQQGRLDFSFGGKLVIRGNISGTFRARIPITAQYE